LGFGVADAAVKKAGGDNFTRSKIAEIIGREKVKVMPDILITGGSGDGTNSALSGLLGMKLMEELGGKTSSAPVPQTRPPEPIFKVSPPTEV
jgi:hypothetical protein